MHPIGVHKVWTINAEAVGEDLGLQSVNGLRIIAPEGNNGSQQPNHERPTHQPGPVSHPAGMVAKFSDKRTHPQTRHHELDKENGRKRDHSQPSCDRQNHIKRQDTREHACEKGRCKIASEVPSLISGKRLSRPKPYQ